MWAMVAVELSEERRVFIIPVENRDTATIRDIVKAHIRLGTII